MKPRKRKSHLRRLFMRQMGRCHWCEQCVSNDQESRKYATIEHLIPLALGGANHGDNLVMACLDCNNKRGCEIHHRGFNLLFEAR